MSADNLSIWNAVSKTDPAYTKPFNRGGFKGTATNATYLARRATEVFGPCGIGWGVKVLDETILDGVPGDKVHRVHIQLWYVLDGKRGEIENYGQTMLTGKNKNGPYTDEEAPKKSLTDAMTKALSLLGFASDVHLGLFDDNKYVNNLKAEFAAASPPKLSAQAEAERDRDWDKRQDQAYGKPTNGGSPVKHSGPDYDPPEPNNNPEPIATVDVPLIKSSAQAKRDGDWEKLETSLKEAEGSFAALLAWPSQQLDIYSRVSSKWKDEIEQIWRAAFTATLAAECQNAGEVKAFGLEYREAIQRMPAVFIDGCRDILGDALRHHRKQPAEDRVPA